VKIISLRVHGFFDYSYVLIYLAAPTVIGFSGWPAKISYAAAVLYFLGAGLTNAPFGIIKLNPIRTHLIVEILYAIATVTFPWLFGFASDHPVRNFYVVMGIIPIVVGLLTDYKGTAQSNTRPAGVT
jgi:hypothetical protein